MFVYVRQFCKCFWVQPIKLSMTILECSVAPDASHFPAMLPWCSIDCVSTRFLVSSMVSSRSQQTYLQENLIRHRDIF